MDVVSVQTKLNAAGYSVGTADGKLGPHTMASVLDFVATRHGGNTTVQLGQAMIPDFAKYQINTPLRMAHFIAQGCHETERWQFFTELGGPSYFAKYDGRVELGNTHPGDGYLFRGRGIFQITGRYNYNLYTQRLGIDLMTNPNRAAEPEMAVLTACMFWSSHNLNTLADADNCSAITHKINGGTNGLKERQDFTDDLKKLFGV